MNRKTGHVHAGLRRRVGTDDAHRSTRRKLLLALGAVALAAPFGSFAQQPGKVWRVGSLGVTAGRHLYAAFVAGMADLGYVEGRNVHYDKRESDGNFETFAKDARALAEARVDLIWVGGTPAAMAAQKATATIPIVFALVADPVYSKLIHSLSAPGGNLTGMTLLLAEIWTKRVEILNEIFPKVRRIGVLHNPLDSSNTAQLPYIREGAKAFGKEVMIVGATRPEEFAAAFAQLKKWRAEALLNAESTLFFQNRQALIEAAAKNHWPTVHSTKEYVDAGGVIAYGADYVQNCRDSAAYVDKIFRGAKPGDLPVQQPTKYEFVLNLKAAKAMGLTIPQSILLRADRVIE
jgi:putative ABC transport system substrate-binding protein